MSNNPFFDVDRLQHGQKLITLKVWQITADQLTAFGLAMTGIATEEPKVNVVLDLNRLSTIPTQVAQMAPINPLVLYLGVFDGTLASQGRYWTTINGCDEIREAFAESAADGTTLRAYVATESQNSAEDAAGELP